MTPRTEQFIAEFHILCEKYDVRGVQYTVYDHDDDPVSDESFIIIDGEHLHCDDLVPAERQETW